MHLLHPTPPSRIMYMNSSTDAANIKDILGPLAWRVSLTQHLRPNSAERVFCVVLFYVGVLVFGGLLVELQVFDNKQMFSVGG